MKIANKISISFFVTTAILTISAVSIIYCVEKENTKAAIFSHLSTAVQSRAYHIETFLEANKEATRQLSESIVIKQLLLTSKEDGDYDQRLNDAMQRLNDTSETLKYFYSLFVLDKTGMVIASDKKADMGLDKRTEPYFLGAKKAAFIKDAYISTYRKTPSCAFSAPIIDNNTGEFLGVIVGRSSLEGVNKITSDETGLLKTGEIYIVNKNGYMITPSRFRKDTFLKLKLDNENIKKAFKDIEKFNTEGCKHVPFVYTDYRGIKVLGIHDHIKLMQWICITKIDEKEVFAPLWKIKVLLMSIIIVVPILSWLIGIFIGGIISRPIHVLRKGSEIIGSGNLDYKVGTNTKDEIGQLSRAFNAMAESLQKTMVSRNTLIAEIAERKKVEEVLSNSMAQLSNAARIAHLGPWEYDVVNDLFIFNDCFYVMFGATAKEFGGYTMSSADYAKHFIHPEDMYIVGLENHKASETNDPDFSRQFEHRIIYADGKTGYIIVRYFIVKDEKGRTIRTFGVNQDITERKKVEEKLAQALREEIKSRKTMISMLDDNNKIREELEKKLEELRQSQNMLVQSEKLASLGTLVSEMAHEVNNPLMIISGNAQLSLMENLEGQPQLKESLEVIKEQCLRAKDIIRRLLVFSKPSKGEIKEANINESLDFVVKLLEHQYSLSNIKITKKYTASLPQIKIDEKQMNEVFMNLLKNSAEAMSAGGTITIVTSKEDGNIRVDFEDTGVGISEENMEKIFDPFFTTKESGTGLGLSVCYGIVKAHGGELRYESKPDEGTSASIFLPINGERKS